MSDRAVSAEALSEPKVLTAKEELLPWWQLLKPRVMVLVVFTGFAGMLAAPGTLHPLVGAIATLCIAVAAGAAGAINMWYERDIDALMARTRRRPVVTGTVKPEEALAFGVILSLFSVLLMALAVNWLAAALLLVANAYYVFVYTLWLKRRTPQNIVIGGAAGAFPPMIGWAATSGEIGWGAIVLFGIIFLWTPPHSWALALYRRGDYAQGGVPMLPVVAGERATKIQTLLYSILLVPVAVLPTLLGFAGYLYGGVALLLSLAFLALSIRLFSDKTEKTARQLFSFSILYLFLLFALLLLDNPASGQAWASWVLRQA